MAQVRAFAGIGSSKTPPEAGAELARIAGLHAAAGFWLYSGGAWGADSFAEQGAAPDRKIIIYGNPRHKQGDRYESIPPQDAHHILLKPGPLKDKAAAVMSQCVDASHWANIVKKGDFVSNLYTRNTMQVVSPDLKTPVELVICWANPDPSDGTVQGGTKGAIRVAQRLHIPWYNLAVKEHRERLAAYIAAGFPERTPAELAKTYAAMMDFGLVTREEVLARGIELLPQQQQQTAEANTLDDLDLFAGGRPAARSIPPPPTVRSMPLDEIEPLLREEHAEAEAKLMAAQGRINAFDATPKDIANDPTGIRSEAQMESRIADLDANVDLAAQESNVLYWQIRTVENLRKVGFKAIDVPHNASWEAALNAAREQYLERDGSSIAASSYRLPQNIDIPPHLRAERSRQIVQEQQRKADYLETAHTLLAPEQRSAVHNDRGAEQDGWAEIAVGVRSGDPNIVVTAGRVYRLGPEDLPGPRGFGGQGWTVKYPDGSERRTTNLWLQGDIPDRYLDSLPQTATVYQDPFRDYDPDTLGWSESNGKRYQNQILTTSKRVLIQPGPIGTETRESLKWDDPRAVAHLERETQSAAAHHLQDLPGGRAIEAARSSDIAYEGPVVWARETSFLQRVGNDIVIHRDERTENDRDVTVFQNLMDRDDRNVRVEYPGQRITSARDNQRQRLADLPNKRTLEGGNLFNSPAEAHVNTVNLVGVMGKGIAKDFKRLYPAMFEIYRAKCASKTLKPGVMDVFDRGAGQQPRYIINFPTKRDWRDDSRIEDVKMGLQALVERVNALGIKSIAVPPLGCGNGNLNWADVEPLIREAAAKMTNTHVEIYAPAREQQIQSQVTRVLPSPTEPSVIPNVTTEIASDERYLPVQIKTIMRGAQTGSLRAMDARDREVLQQAYAVISSSIENGVAPSWFNKWLQNDLLDKMAQRITACRTSEDKSILRDSRAVILQLVTGGAEHVSQQSPTVAQRRPLSDVDPKEVGLHPITVGSDNRGDKGEYIGRGGRNRYPRSPLANPFEIGKPYNESILVEAGAPRDTIAKFTERFRGRVFERGDTIDLYRAWLSAKIKNNNPPVMAELNRLTDIAAKQPLQVVCHCAPHACHGDVVRQAVILTAQRRLQNTNSAANGAVKRSSLLDKSNGADSAAKVQPQQARSSAGGMGR